MQPNNNKKRPFKEQEKREKGDLSICYTTIRIGIVLSGEFLFKKQLTNNRRRWKTKKNRKCFYGRICLLFVGGILKNKKMRLFLAWELILGIWVVFFIAYLHFICLWGVNFWTSRIQGQAKPGVSFLGRFPKYVRCTLEPLNTSKQPANWE